MNQQTPPKRALLPSIFTTLQHLFVPGRDASYFYWSLGVITLLGMVIRIWQIRDPIEYDEAYTFIYFATREFKHILADYSAPNNHILHTILVRLSYEIFGRQPWIVRLPALLAGTLCIPAAYFAARRLFGAYMSLTGAGLVALTPWFINYSANGRGYTLLVLLSLLLANLGALLLQQQSRIALAAYAVIAALGFYTIPVFLYPMSGISLWVLVTYLTGREPWNERSSKSVAFLGACIATGVLTLILYAPVIFFGTGWDSITSNEFVASRDGMMFVENLLPRATRTWESWMSGIAPQFQFILLAGFLLSLFFHRKLSSQRTFLPLYLILAIAILLVLQRVAPLPRVWLYLEAFYIIFAGAGLAWMVERLLKGLGIPNFAKIIPALVLLVVLVVFAQRYLNFQQGRASPNRQDLPEQYAAEFLTSELQAGDRILSTAPVDIQTAYYLYMNGVPYEMFYQKDHPVDFQQAVIVLRTTSKYNSPESVLDFYKIAADFDLESTQLVFEYGPLNIYSVPAK